MRKVLALFLAVALSLIAGIGVQAEEFSEVQCRANFASDGGKRPALPICSSKDSSYLGPIPWLRNSTKSSARQNLFPEYLHIAKNGGATILHLNLSLNGRLDGPTGFQGVGPSRFSHHNETLQTLKKKNQVCYDAQTPPRNSVFFEPWKWQPTFCVIRHPLHHLVSALNFNHDSQHYCKRNHTCYNDLLRNLANMMMEEQFREHDPGFSPAAYNLSAADESPIRPLASRPKKSMPIEFCHLIPQSDYIWNAAGERTCNYVLRFEHLEDDFAALSALYGKPSADASGVPLITSGHQHDHTVISSSDFTTDDIEPDVQEIYHKIYAADFCLLGYSLNASAPTKPLLVPSVRNAQFRQCAYMRDSSVKVDLP